MIGLLINMTVQTIVSNKRIKEFLVADEVDQTAVDYSENGYFLFLIKVVVEYFIMWVIVGPVRLSCFIFLFNFEEFWIFLKFQFCRKFKVYEA